jgi:hypothetical protein
MPQKLPALFSLISFSSSFYELDFLVDSNPELIRTYESFYVFGRTSRTARAGGGGGESCREDQSSTTQKHVNTYASSAIRTDYSGVTRLIRSGHFDQHSYLFVLFNEAFPLLNHVAPNDSVSSNLSNELEIT